MQAIAKSSRSENILIKKKFSTLIMNKAIALAFQAQAGHIQSTSILALARNL